MTAPLYLIDGGPADALLVDVRPGSTVVLDGAEGRHAATVRRTRPGERVDVADGGGTVARCVVAQVRAGRVDLLVDAVEHLPEPTPRLVLVQALAKGGRDELAVQTATELGVDEVVPWQAGRSVVVWSGERGRRAHAKWAGALRAAAKQARRPRVPVLADPVDLTALADRVGVVSARGGLAFVLHEDADAPLAARTVPQGCGEVLVVVGPEGGLQESELARLGGAGAEPVRLGRTVLRSCSAGPAALTLLSVRLGRWG